MSSSQAIRALTDSSDTLFLAALSSGDRACFLCASSAHLAPDCPRFKAIKENDFARRSLARLLGSLVVAATPASPALLVVPAIFGFIIVKESQKMQRSR
jgi:hypothetical protein